MEYRKADAALAVNTIFEGRAAMNCGEPKTEQVLATVLALGNHMPKVPAVLLQRYVGLPHEKGASLVPLIFGTDPEVLFKLLSKREPDLYEVARLKAELLHCDFSKSRMAEAFQNLPDYSVPLVGGAKPYSPSTMGWFYHSLLGAYNSALSDLGVSELPANIFPGVSDVHHVDGRLTNYDHHEIPRVIRDLLAPKEFSSVGDYMKDNGFRAGSVAEILDYILDCCCRAMIKGIHPRDAVFPAFAGQNAGIGPPLIFSVPNYLEGNEARMSCPVVVAVYPNVLDQYKQLRRNLIEIQTVDRKWRGGIPFPVKPIP